MLCHAALHTGYLLQKRLREITFEMLHALCGAASHSACQGFDNAPLQLWLLVAGSHKMERLTRRMYSGSAASDAVCQNVFLHHGWLLQDRMNERERLIRRSHSAVELRSYASMSRGSSEGNLGDLERLTVELTTPEGHTYRVGRLTQDERAQKILR